MIEIYQEKPKDVAKEPIRLKLHKPYAGRVRVSLVDADGKELDAGCVVDFVEVVGKIKLELAQEVNKEFVHVDEHRYIEVIHD